MTAGKPVLRCAFLISFSLPHRCQLFVRPSGCLHGQFAPSAACISWKEQVHRSSEVHSVLQCPSTVSGFLPLMVSTLAVPDDLRHIASQGEEDWDPAYVIHLFPLVTLRNLLPYTVRYMMEVHLHPWQQQRNTICYISDYCYCDSIRSLKDQLN